MSDELELIERIQANAELVIAVARDHFGEEIGYDESGVAWLARYAQERHEQGEAGENDALISTLGSYLGECIIHTYGGEWRRRDGMIGVHFDDASAAFPFSKIAKHLANGEEDSVLPYFKDIPVLFRMTRMKGG